MAGDNGRKMKIWMHTIGYPPKRIGGTEVHVKDLAEEMVRRGHEVHVSFDSDKTNADRNMNGVNIHEGSPEAEIRRNKPDVIHFHPLYAHEVIRLMNAVARDFPVITTYHTPTISCPRGSLLYYGEIPCDGCLKQRRCTACLFQSRGLSKTVAVISSAMPRLLFRIMSAAVGKDSRAASMAGWPERIERQRDDFLRMCSSSRRIIAVCEWLKEMIVLNGIEREKVTIVRYGRNIKTQSTARMESKGLRLGYLGRLVKEKGIGMILDAMGNVPSGMDITVEFVSPAFAEEGTELGEEEKRYADIIRKRAVQDKRVIIGGAVDACDVAGVLSRWDALIVPSIWMETGPQVVTESLMAGTPVIGSRRGGIQELVRDGIDGILYEAGNTGELARICTELALNPDKIRKMRGSIAKVRTVQEMTEDVQTVYKSVI